MAENEKSVSWEIKEHLAVLKEGSNGWKKELNIVSWNDGPARFDIRDWSEDHHHMAKGVTMNMDEGRKVYEAMTKYFEREKEREARDAREHSYER